MFSNNSKLPEISPIKKKKILRFIQGAIHTDHIIKVSDCR